MITESNLGKKVRFYSTARCNLTRRRTNAGVL
jgi:hypothetical protein